MMRIRKNTRWWHLVMIISVLLVLLSPLASSSPDGLERVAEDKGFIDAASAPPVSIIADYVFPGVENQALATILAGLSGIACVFFIVYGLSLLLKLRKKRAPR